MKRNLLIGSFVFFSTFMFSQESQESFIVGGRDVLEDEFPWMVELISNNEHHCGGALIAPNWVLTAAHCLKEVPTYGISLPDRVIINNIDRAQAHGNSEEINIQDIHNHQNFTLSANTELDIGLIYLATPSNIDPVLINDTDPMLLSVDDTVYTMGWGLSSPSGNLLDKLKIARPIVKSLTSDIIEAGFDAGEDEEGAAAGDSGGPLFINTSDGYRLVGLVSGGAGPTTTAGSPGIFTRVFAYTNWIDSVMQEEAVGINENIDNQITVYQNDNLDLYIFNSKTFNTNTTYSIFNALGQEMVHGKLKDMVSIQKIETPLLAPGTYSIKINNTSTFNFVK